MEDELLAGLIAIAVAIGVGLAPIWHVLRGERNAVRDIHTQMRNDMEQIRNEMHATNSRLEQIVLSGIDEKTTVLVRYIVSINTWSDKEAKTEEAFKVVIDSIKSDIQSCAKYNSSMRTEQRTLLYGTLRKIAEALRNKGYHAEAGEIEDLRETLFGH